MRSESGAIDKKPRTLRRCGAPKHQGILLWTGTKKSGCLAHSLGVVFPEPDVDGGQCPRRRFSRSELRGELE